MTSVSSSSDRVLYPLAATGLLMLLLFGFAMLPRLLRPMDSSLVGQSAPDFTLPALANAVSDKPQLTLSELRGRPVVLDFWATWCPPCRAEAPVLDRVAQRFRERGLVVVGVSQDDEDSVPRAWVSHNKLSYPIVHDAQKTTAQQYGVDSLPTLVVVSKTGTVLAVRTGMTDAAELERLVAQAW